MYRITKDKTNHGKYRMTYYPFTEVHEYLYEMENLEWKDVSSHISSIVENTDDTEWMFDLVRLIDKQIILMDSGSWEAI